jgi:hypothetical protein
LQYCSPWLSGPTPGFAEFDELAEFTEFADFFKFAESLPVHKRPQHHKNKTILQLTIDPQSPRKKHVPVQRKEIFSNN